LGRYLAHRPALDLDLDPAPDLDSAPEPTPDLNINAFRKLKKQHVLSRQF
jgi:hypothetical protein